MIADSHARRVILDIVERLKKEYQPEKIILFGSYAYGQPTRDSDIDLFIIKDTAEPPFYRGITVRRICHDPHRHVPFEPLVVTPSEWAERLEMGDPFFEEIRDKGQVLYAVESNGAISETRDVAMVRETGEGYVTQSDKESRLPKDWFAKAAKDLKRVDALLAIDDDEDAGFHLQQAAEKYLKGYLLGRGWKLKRTHDLDELLDEALKHDSQFETFREACRFADQYYTFERYPFPLIAVPPRAELESAIAKIRELIAYIIRQTPAEQ